nr:probable transcription factor KAN2 isoform X1 [Tanacetum cinerariifolium]
MYRTIKTTDKALVSSGQSEVYENASSGDNYDDIMFGIQNQRTELLTEHGERPIVHQDKEYGDNYDDIMFGIQNQRTELLTEHGERPIVHQDKEYGLWSNSSSREVLLHGKHGDFEAYIPALEEMNLKGTKNERSSEVSSSSHSETSHKKPNLEFTLGRDCDVENGKWSCIYAVESQEYQMVCTRLDIASAGVGMLDKLDYGLQIDVQVFVDFDYAIGRSITVMEKVRNIENKNGINIRSEHLPNLINRKRLRRMRREVIVRCVMIKFIGRNLIMLIGFLSLLKDVSQWKSRKVHLKLWMNLLMPDDQNGYFKGTLFQRVVKHFVIQRGDYDNHSLIEDWTFREKRRNQLEKRFKVVMNQPPFRILLII